MKRKFWVAIFTYIIFSAIPLYAAWWEVKNLPIPPHTQEEKQESRKGKSSELDIIFYTSTLSAKEIRDFYQQKLTALGWKESNSWEELNKISSAKISPELAQLSKDNLIFKKDNQMFVMRFLSHGKETKYIVGRSKITPPAIKPFDLSALAKTGFKPEIVPEYPAAKLVNFSQDAEGLKLVYFSQDSPEPIAAFYRQNMPNFGWQLDKEDIIDSKESKVKELNFLKGNFQKCGVYLFRLPPDDQAEDVLNYTIIAVNYEKKS